MASQKANPAKPETAAGLGIGFAVAASDPRVIVPLPILQAAYLSTRFRLRPAELACWQGSPSGGANDRPTRNGDPRCGRQSLRRSPRGHRERSMTDAPRPMEPEILAGHIDLASEALEGLAFQSSAAARFLQRGSEIPAAIEA